MALSNPAYAAPELLRDVEFGPPSDLYSLGLIMLEMRTGKPAVTGSSPLDVMIQQLTDKRVVIPQAISATLLGRFIARAIEKEPTSRYHSALDMLSALETIEAGWIEVTEKKFRVQSHSEKSESATDAAKGRNLTSEGRVTPEQGSRWLRF